MCQYLGWLLLISPPIINTVSYCKVDCITSLRLSQETTQIKKHSLAAIRRVFFFSLFFFFKISSPSRCARQHPMIVMRLESVHATASLGQAGRKGKTDYHFHSVCIVGAPEPTSELLLPLLDWSCQSCSAHVCVIPTTNTSTTAACSDEQAQTYVYAYS